MTEQTQAGSVRSIRVTEDERASLEAAAQRSRTTLSDVACSAFERGSQVARPRKMRLAQTVLQEAPFRRIFVN
jgi:uncharacterized protein (DUF1778 family)